MKKQFIALSLSLFSINTLAGTDENYQCVSAYKESNYARFTIEKVNPRVLTAKGKKDEGGSTIYCFVQASLTTYHSDGTIWGTNLEESYFSLVRGWVKEPSSEDKAIEYFFSTSSSDK
ncbi:hypothetical protein L1D14_07585 [Vibrio tubiashii]|uniref:hypothetical protein n=1 Tax=Vibrio tubiashii TaxID=29498 RepID=UPI001EFC8493|nr:hypothetical protein [Vibrio tubiashii]MCG9576100.1 hypothetical protein [Vibrio tubiashii]